MRIAIFLFFVFYFVHCSTTGETVKPKVDNSKLQIENPAGNDEKVFNEMGEEVQTLSTDPDFFKKKSTDRLELFRVRVSS